MTLALLPDRRGGAHISECGRYRYNLWRGWSQPGTGPQAGEAPLFVMLNPSTADAETDDATIRKCIGFATRWGFRYLTVVNVFAYRATDPKKLLDLSPEDRVGPLNDEAIRSNVESHELIVAAWGAQARRIDPQRLDRVRNLLGSRVRCLRKSVDGQPWHPLYVPYDTALEAL